jgi:hypothetical protein
LVSLIDLYFLFTNRQFPRCSCPFSSGAIIGTLILQCSPQYTLPQRRQ